MHIYQQSGFLPQWSIICIGKYRSDEICTSSLNTRALIYISMCIYIHVHAADCYCYGYCDFVNFGQMRVVNLSHFLC